MTSQEIHTAAAATGSTGPTGGAGPAGPSFSVLNPAYSGGADRTGSTDCSGAFQAALNALAAYGGGTLYVPAGNYQLANGVTWNSSAPLRIAGDGPQASNIRCASTSTSITYVSITNDGSITERGNDGTVIIQDLAFYNDHYIGAFSDTNIALYLDNVNFGQIANVGIYKGNASQRINQGIVLNACNQIDIDNCNIFASVNGVAVTGFSQVNNIRSTSVWTPAGTGVPTAAGVLVQGQCLTQHMSQVVFHDGDRGLYWTQDSGGNVPHLFFGYDLEPNNHAIAAMEFGYGAQVYLDQCIFSAAMSILKGNVPGLVFGPGFQGSAVVNSSVFNGQQGHTVQIGGGAGFIFTGCEFGGNGTYKYAANSCDEINIAGNVGGVTIDACHFNVDALAGYGSSNSPRSAVYAASGTTGITVVNSRGAGAAGYGTSAIVDDASAVMRRGNIGLGLADTTVGSGSTVTTATNADLSAAFTIPANDATVGTVYKLTCWGTGTEATGTAVTLSIGLAIGGASPGAFSPAALPAAGAPFSWKYECHVYVTATGPSGSITPSAVFTWGSTPTVSNDTAQAVNTTQPNQIVLVAEWASTAGSPAITCLGTILERLPSCQPG
jgi:hypothetical protein